MFNRVRGLFRRYADRHLYVKASTPPAITEDGALLGQVESIAVHGNRLRIDGWTKADQVFLAWQDAQIVQRPHLRRDDLPQQANASSELGFSIEAPLSSSPYGLGVRQGSAETLVPLRPPSAKALTWARRRLSFRFAANLVLTVPAVIGWFTTHDPIYRSRVKSILGLDAVPLAGPMDSALFQDGAPPSAPSRPITIVLPVYNAFDLLEETLRRVVEHTDLPWHLVIIEDCSPDARILPFLRDWQARFSDRVQLLENARNEGFIRSVNKGLRVALERGQDAVLLNSDAFVPPNWASRLLAPIYTHDHVASTTPMSNDAEIFSVPAICARTVLNPGEADAIDAVAQQLNPEAALSNAPTGVGFCMAMNIAYLRQVPALDTRFGRGYGEEVDWCQKTMALGGRHLGVASVFVEHRGGESFGSAAKQALIIENNAIISQRYPTYDQAVQDFIQSDPLISARVALAIAYVAAHAADAVPVYLAHSLGGGAEIYLQDRIARDLSHGVSSIVLRVGGAQRFQVEVRTASGETSGTTDDPMLVKRLLAPLRQKKIIYSCGVGDPNPVDLPGLLMSLREPRNGDRIEVLFHDFFPVSPSYCLLDKDGCYRGPVTRERRDPAHSIRQADKRRVSLNDWQSAWAPLLAEAALVTVFSADSRNQILATYPDIHDKVQLAPHRIHSDVPALPRPDTQETVIGVLGNIGRQKGAKVLEDLATVIEGRPGMRLVLIGNLDPAYKLPAKVPVHGNYTLSDLPALAARYGVTCWLIPSIWPETFSYTTHECLATTLPVFAFDIGAQGDAVKLADNGHCVPYDPRGDLAKAVLDCVIHQGEIGDG